MFLGDDNAAISEEECSSSPVPAPRSAAPPQEQPNYENVTLEAAAPAEFDNEGNDISQQVSSEGAPAQETAEPEQPSPVVNRSRTSSTRCGL